MKANVTHGIAPVAWDISQVQKFHILSDIIFIADCRNGQNLYYLTWYVFLMIAFSVGNAGILSEAKWLLDMGLEPNSNSATRAIGYRQVYTGLCLSPFCLSLSFYTEIVTHSCLNTFECSLGGIGVILVQILN